MIMFTAENIITKRRERIIVSTISTAVKMKWQLKHNHNKITYLTMVSPLHSRDHDDDRGNKLWYPPLPMPRY